MGIMSRSTNANERSVLIKVLVVLCGVLLIGFWYKSVSPKEQAKMVNIVDEKKIMEETSEIWHEEAPRVLYWPNYLSDEECDRIVNHSLPFFKRSAVAVNDKNAKVDSLDEVNSVRTSSGTWIQISDKIVSAFTRRNSLWSGVPRKNGEDIQILQYMPGQYYKPHFDFFDPDYYESYLVNGGQRVATILCFLNDVEEGGETLFPEIDLAVPPTKGSAILWYNTYLNGTLDRMALHGGNPVKKGVKYVAVQWLREKTIQR